VSSSPGYVASNSFGHVVSSSPGYVASNSFGHVVSSSFEPSKQIASLPSQTSSAKPAQNNTDTSKWTWGNNENLYLFYAVTVFICVMMCVRPLNEIYSSACVKPHVKKPIVSVTFNPIVKGRHEVRSLFSKV
jgi:hypothetical protein